MMRTSEGNKEECTGRCLSPVLASVLALVLAA